MPGSEARMPFKAWAGAWGRVLVSLSCKSNSASPDWVLRAASSKLMPGPHGSRLAARGLGAWCQRQDGGGALAWPHGWLGR